MCVEHWFFAAALSAAALRQSSQPPACLGHLRLQGGFGIAQQAYRLLDSERTLEKSNARAFRSRSPSASSLLSRLPPLSPASHRFGACRRSATFQLSRILHEP